MFEAWKSSALNLEGTCMRNKIHCPLILDLCADDPNKGIAVCSHSHKEQRKFARSKRGFEHT